MCLSLDLSPCHYFSSTPSPSPSLFLIYSFSLIFTISHLLLLPHLLPHRLLLLVSHLLLNLHVLLLRHALLLHYLHSYTHLCCHLIYLIFFFPHLLLSLPLSFPSLLSSYFLLFFISISSSSHIFLLSLPHFFFLFFSSFFLFSLVARLVSSDILESLSSNFEQHAGDEKMAEWAYVTPSSSFFNSHFHIFLSIFFNRFSNFFIFL